MNFQKRGIAEFKDCLPVEQAHQLSIRLIAQLLYSLVREASVAFIASLASLPPVSHQLQKASISDDVH